MNLEVIKVAGLLLVGAATLIAVWWSLADRQSPPHLYWSRYVADLDFRLRAMFLSTKGWTVANAQLIVLVLLIPVGVAIQVRGWLLLSLLIAVLPLAYLSVRARQRVQKLEAKLDGFILTLANALKTTPNLTAALQMTQEVLSPPLSDEVGLVLKEIKLGATVDQALLNMSVRVKSSQLDAALATIMIGRKTGGNLTEILEVNAQTIREIARLHAVVRTKTAESKYQSYVLLGLPVMAVAGIETVMPGFFAPLQQSIQGLAVLMLALVLWVSAFFAMRSITRVDV